MANSENKRLAVDVIARIDKLEKGMAKAAGTVDKRTGDMERRTQKFASTFESNMAGAVTKVNGALGKLGLGGLAAGGIAGIVAGFREVAAGVADIGAEAQRAGLSNKVFQELKFAAEQSRIGVDALTDGMKELALRTDEFIVSGGKTGSAAEAFQRLGFTVDELKEKIKDPSALLTEIIGKVQQLDKAAQVRIFDELFGGTGGEQFVRFIDAGEDGLRRNIKAANDLGIVLNDEVIAKAAEVDRQFNLIAATIGGNLKAAIVDAFSVLAAFIDSYRDVQNQMNSTIDNRVAELGSQRLDIENKILEAKERQAELDRAGMLNPLSQATTGVDLKAYEEQLRAVADEEARLVNERNKRIQLEPAALPTSAPASSYNGGAAVPASGGGGSKKSKGSDPYANAAASIRERIAALQAETAAQARVNPLIEDYGFALSQAQAKQDLLSAAQKAGLTVTPELAGNIDQLATAYANASVDAQKLADSQESMQAAAEEFKATSKDMVSGFVNDLRSGKSAAEALEGALNKVLDKVIDIAINAAFDGIGGGGGGGGGGGFFGSILKIFGFARGGYVSGAGGPRSDSIPARLSNGEFVVNADATKRNRALLESINSGGGVAGFADGGFVGGGRSSGIATASTSTPSISLPDVRQITAKIDNRVHVSVSVTEDGNLQAFVQRQSAEVSAQVVQATAPSIVDRSVDASGAALRKGKFDNGMASYGLKRRSNVG